MVSELRERRRAENKYNIFSCSKQQSSELMIANCFAILLTGTMNGMLCNIHSDLNSNWNSLNNSWRWKIVPIYTQLQWFVFGWNSAIFPCVHFPFESVMSFLIFHIKISVRTLSLEFRVSSLESFFTFDSLGSCSIVLNNRYLRAVQFLCFLL